MSMQTYTHIVFLCKFGKGHPVSSKKTLKQKWHMLSQPHTTLQPHLSAPSCMSAVPASEPAVPLRVTGERRGLPCGPAAAGSGRRCTPSVAPRCVLLTGNTCVVGKCIFGVQPTSSLNANYENSFSKAFTPDLT